MEIRSPNRVTRSYVQRLHAAPARVFPLLCPVREAEWIEGWDPKLVISASGVAEADCVFVTAAPGTEPAEAIWFVTRHEPDRFVEMLKFTPGATACRLTIGLRSTASGCDAEVTYRHTSLGPAGDAFVAAFTESHYLDLMHSWEARLNHYLDTGQMLRPAAGP
jgi:hypothetical protein